MPSWTIADIPSLHGTTAVVTGGNSGIGWQTALALARAGARVTLTARTDAKGQDAVDRIRSAVPAADVRFDLLDLASLRSVRGFAARAGAERQIDLLVNNAGVMAIPAREATEDGFERQLATNFLGPFALTGLLLPALLRAPAPRVTTISSIAAWFGLRRINFDDLQWERSYKAWDAYCQSKLADLMFMLELARRSTAAGAPLISTGAHPGYARTNLQTAGRGKPVEGFERHVERVVSQDAAHGALPSLRAATAPDAVNGRYYGPDGILQLKGDPVPIPIPKSARDEAARRRLWEASERLTGVSFLPSS
jgi:NAD(P)-dependent dehydrogenase (short-subunit alcohol dehydrogenase family)